MSTTPSMEDLTHTYLDNLYTGAEISQNKNP